MIKSKPKHTICREEIFQLPSTHFLLTLKRQTDKNYGNLILSTFFLFHFLLLWRKKKTVWLSEPNEQTFFAISLSYYLAPLVCSSLKITSFLDNFIITE
jgi:hypothetical protein